MNLEKLPQYLRNKFNSLFPAPGKNIYFSYVPVRKLWIDYLKKSDIKTVRLPELIKMLNNNKLQEKVVIQAKGLGPIQQLAIAISMKRRECINFSILDHNSSFMRMINSAKIKGVLLKRRKELARRIYRITDTNQESLDFYVLSKELACKILVLDSMP